jgi:Fe-S cluster biogenesis protein NfuA
MSKFVEDKINTVLNTIRYYIQRDGGDLEFTSFVDGVLKLQILGACVGCQLSDSTYKDGVSEIIKMEVPEVKKIEYTEGDNLGKEPLYPK